MTAVRQLVCVMQTVLRAVSLSWRAESHFVGSELRAVEKNDRRYAALIEIPKAARVGCEQARRRCSFAFVTVIA